MSNNLDEFEAALRDALRAEAATVTPSPRGLAEIRARLGRRRHTWLQPALAVVAVATVAAAAAVVGVVFLAGTGAHRPSVITPAHGPTPKATVARAPRYLAVVSGRLVAVDGRQVHRVAVKGPAAAGGRLTDLQSAGTATVYALQQTGGCANRLVRIDRAAGGSAVVATASAGSVIAGYAADGPRLALVETACDGSGGFLLARNGSASHTISWQGNPPTAAGNPVWVNRDQIDLVWRTGTQAMPYRVSAFTDHRIDTGAPACGGFDPARSLVTDLAGGPDGAYLVAVAAGHVVVQRCSPTTETRPLFTIPAGTTLATAAAPATATGQTRMLVLDGTGRLWWWPGGSAKARPLGHAPQGITAVAF